MNKCLVAVLISLGLTSCATKNEHYYKTHPNKLQESIRACPEKQPQGMTCQQLEVLANHMNKLAYELQMSPQGFGKKIIALQETIAEEEEQLKTESPNDNLQISLTQNKNKLADYLAIVKWFESPTS